MIDIVLVASGGVVGAIIGACAALVIMALCRAASVQPPEEDSKEPA